jgi:tRNA (cmo5U34)-methyltransferase
MTGINLWPSAAHALDYLRKADSLPHRTEGETELLECLPASLSRVLDLGSGDGRLLALVKLARPNVSAVALDFSPTMIERLRRRFADDPSVTVSVHDLDYPLPHSLGTFDAIVSSFAIHHVTHA